MVHISPVVALAFVMPSAALHISRKSKGEEVPVISHNWKTGEEVPVCTPDTQPSDIWSCPEGQMGCTIFGGAGTCNFVGSLGVTGCYNDNPERQCTAHSDCTGYGYFNSDGYTCELLPTPPPTPSPPCDKSSGTCTISEDPHISVFDGLEVSLFRTAGREANKAQSEEDAGDKWLVKSGQVSIQARYVANDELPDRNIFVRAIAVGGTFLNSSSLIVGSLEDQITWDGQPILQENASYFEVQTGEAFVKAMRGEDSLLVQDLSNKHRGVSIELPLGVNLIVNRLPKHINVAIKMRPQEDQEGLCGNFNGVGADDSFELASMRFDVNVNPEASLFDGLKFS